PFDVRFWRLGAITFLAERKRPIHLSKFPVLAAMPKRFCNECEPSELFRLCSISPYLRLHGQVLRLVLLTRRCKPLFRAQFARAIICSAQSRPRLIGRTRSRSAAISFRQ